MTMRQLYWMVPATAACILALAFFSDRNDAPERSERAYYETALGFPNEFRRLHYEMRTREGDDGPAYPANYRVQELEKAVALKKGNSLARPWTSRGPGNVGGRTRGLIVDPDDATGNTWFAGAVGGGIWKTTNGGANWENLTPNLPYIAIATLVMAPSNHNVLYAGTGEGFGFIASISGDGIFKSTDRGQTWEQLESVSLNPDFRYVNRIIVDPTSEDVLLAATNEGLFRSTNGGEGFSEVYRGNRSRVQHIVADPTNFNVQYMSVNAGGVYKSVDAGITWNQVLPGSAGDRIELAVAPSNPNWVYAAAESRVSLLYLSTDAGATWAAIADTGVEPDWMGAQGFHNNTIAVHPFDEKIVFVGGIAIWRIEIGDNEGVRTRVKGMTVDEVSDFLTMVSFTDDFADGLGLGPDEGAVGITDDDFVAVEIRWGPGRSQKAHRFTVPIGSTSGVPPESYQYADYVDVPFEVWDLTNNRQLMVSFRDQARDGGFDLLDYGTREDGREYVFVNAIPYNPAAPDNRLIRSGGHTQKLIYFLWFTLNNGLDWNSVDIPTSRIVIDAGEEATRSGTSAALTCQNFCLTSLHVDQHNLVVYNENPGAGTFSVLNANDGGVGVSLNNGTTWNQKVGGYVTTQFYSADKKPGANIYVGGAQDNGTWQSPADPSDASAWSARVGGDGLEVLWHPTKPDLILASSQYNRIQKSTDGGVFFSPATNGMTDDSEAGGLFLTRLAKSRIDPDLVFSAGQSGVWRSDDFADNWTLSPVDITQWNATNLTDVTISQANAQVVWAGARATSGAKVHVSRDGGLSFEPVTILSNDFGLTVGIETHPSEEGTAYVLFSMFGLPKVVRTTDYGSSWEDISGFLSGGGTSDNGFPDVAVYSLLVLPHRTNEIWAGTEIGLFISEDNGESWAFADDGLPAVSIWDMKIVDDQVVIATLGRGIWSVQIPELLTAPPPDLPPAPRLNDAIFNPTGSLAIDLDLRAAFDSVQIRADNSRVGSSGPVSAGDTTIQAPFNSTGSYAVQAVAYKNGKTFFSPGKQVIATSVRDKQWSYENDFSNSRSGDVFARSGFAMTTGESRWFATTNPYPVNAELTATLAIPIIVSDSISTLRWSDVALVQPGLQGSEYPELAFRDYVIVEATVDGLTWLPLVDGYDARFNNDWLAQYSLGQAPARSLLVEHEVDLRDTFAADERIFIRFRLHSDGSTTGWGWAIADLQIQPGAPVANEAETELPDEFVLHANYPNPFNPSTNISFSLPSRSNATVQIFDLNGRLVETLVRGEMDAGTHLVRWDASGVASGTYIYRLTADTYVEARKLLLVR